jgi:anti-anti-sigma factor
MMIIKEVPVEEKFGDLWVLLPDAISMYSCREIDAAVSKKINSSIKRIVLNMSKTYNLFSSGLRLMLSLRKKINLRGGELVLVNVSAQIRQLLTDLNLDKVFKIFSTEIEFEVSHEDVWNQKNTEIETGFVFLVETEQDICHITVSGEMVSGQDFSKCEQFTPQPGIKKFIIDLSSLNMIDASGATALLELATTVNTAGTALRAFGAAEMIKETLALFGVDQFLAYYKDEKSAMEDR